MFPVPETDGRPPIRFTSELRARSTSCAPEAPPPANVLRLPEIKEKGSLTGVMRLFSTDLLYVDLLLRYQPAMDAVNTEAQSEKTMADRPHYFLKERRRIKFREVHFIDHPRFGAILTVSPVTVEK